MISISSRSPCSPSCTSISAHLRKPHLRKQFTIVYSETSYDAFWTKEICFKISTPWMIYTALLPSSILHITYLRSFFLYFTLKFLMIPPTSTGWSHEVVFLWRKTIFIKDCLLIYGLASIGTKVTGKQIDRGGGYGLGVPCTYAISGQEKAVGWPQVKTTNIFHEQENDVQNCVNK